MSTPTEKPRIKVINKAEQTVRIFTAGTVVGPFQWK